MMMTTIDETTTTTRRRTRRSASTTAGGAARTRRPRASGDELLAQLIDQVDRLIAENRDLKRAIAKAEKAAGGGLGQASSALAGLQRRVSQALADVPRPGGRRGAAETAPRPRRKVTDPDVLERRPGRAQYSHLVNRRVSAGMTSHVINAPITGIVTRNRSGSASCIRTGAAATVMAVISG
jgi:cell division septum initiation protein DivIVA